MKPDTISRFVQELKRRRVFRGIIVYGASTLILLEAAQNLCNAFGIEAVPRWFVWLLGIGFFGSLWFSWIYDFTPGGIVKTEPAKHHPAPIPNNKLRTYKLTTFLSIIIIIGLLCFRIIDDIAKKKVDRIEKSIAVLSLFDDDFSPNEAHNFGFIGYEITSRLLKVTDYRVIPWEDTRKYLRAEQTYSGIGEELSAAILVFWKPHETNVGKFLSVHLISAEDEHLLWSENYEIEENWSSSEICRCSRKISKKITRRLRTFLTLEERDLINEQPVSARASMLTFLGTAMTRDSWEKVQTGNNVNEKGENRYYDSISFERAIGFFTEAIKEDSTFAAAYANRAKARLWGIRANYINKSELDDCREDILEAFRLHPDLPEAHLAMGLYFYYGLNEPLLAHVYIDKAVELKPYNNEYLFYLAKIKSTLGRWDEAHLLADKVFGSNPRNVLFLTNLGTIYLYLNEFARSIECHNRAIELIPQWYAPYMNKIQSLTSTGNITEARTVLKTAEEMTGKIYYRTEAELDLYEGKYKSAIRHVEQAKVSEFNSIAETEGDVYLLKAMIYKHAGYINETTEYFKLAANFFEDLVMFDPKNSIAYSRLGIAYAGIGKNQKAIENGTTALELIKHRKNAITDPIILYNMIQTYVITGHHESALNMMDELLNLNSPFTQEFIKLNADLKHLLNDPGIALINH